MPDDAVSPLLGLVKDVGTLLGQIQGLKEQIYGVGKALEGQVAGIKGEVTAVNAELRIVKHDKEAIDAWMGELSRSLTVLTEGQKTMTAMAAQHEERLRVLESLADQGRGAWWGAAKIFAVAGGCASAIAATGVAAVWFWRHMQYMG